MVAITVLNTTVLVITQSHLSISQASSCFKCLNMHMFTYTTPTFITEAHHLVTRVYTATINNFYSELTPYTVLANSYWVNFHDALSMPRPRPLMIMSTVAI